MTTQPNHSEVKPVADTSPADVGEQAPVAQDAQQGEPSRVDDFRLRSRQVLDTTNRAYKPFDSYPSARP